MQKNSTMLLGINCLTLLNTALIYLIFFTFLVAKSDLLIMTINIISLSREKNNAVFPLVWIIKKINF